MIKNKIKVINRIIGAICIVIGTGGALYLILTNREGTIAIAFIGSGLVGIGIHMLITGSLSG